MQLLPVGKPDMLSMLCAGSVRPAGLRSVLVGPVSSRHIIVIASATFGLGRKRRTPVCIRLYVVLRIYSVNMSGCVLYGCV